MTALSKRILFVFLFALLMHLIIRPPLSCAAKAKKLYQGTITIGMETWPGYFPLIIARDKGYFKEEGVDVEIKRYLSLGELSKDYVGWKMQGRANITFEAVKEALEGLDHKAVLAIDYSNGADAIVAGPSIQTVQDFEGKRTGYEPHTLEEFFLDWALDENGLDIMDVVAVAANPEDSVKKLVAGEIDVAVTHEPFLSQAISAGDFHVVYSSKDAPGLITDILTFRTDFIEAYPDTVKAILRSYYRALKFWKEHPEEANQLTAKEFGVTPGEIAVQLQGIKMLDAQDNLAAFTYASGLRSLYGNLRRTGKFVAAEWGKSRKPPDAQMLAEPSLIRSVAREADN